MQLLLHAVEQTYESLCNASIASHREIFKVGQMVQSRLSSKSVGLWLSVVFDQNWLTACHTCRQPLLQQQQQQQQQMMLSAPQDNYLASRNQALHEVESAIRDIGGIFQQLAHMVSLITKKKVLYCIKQSLSHPVRSSVSGELADEAHAF